MIKTTVRPLVAPSPKAGFWGTAAPYFSMTIAQSVGRQKLGRTPEPDAVTDDPANVAEYSRVQSSTYAILYAVTLEMLHRARPEQRGGAALDLACGPGLFSLELARRFDFASITGIDLSQPMIETARAHGASTSRVRFRVGDIRRLPETSASVDLSCFLCSAHHLPEIDDVRRVFREMDRVTHPDGLILALDTGRLRTSGITERYVNAAGRDYLDRGMNRFFEDFRNSMYASWTPDELRGAIPGGTGRVWRHVVPRGLPLIQFIVGLPVGRKRLFLRSGLPWTENEHPVPAESRQEWKMLRFALRMGRTAPIYP